MIYEVEGRMITRASVDGALSAISDALTEHDATPTRDAETSISFTSQASMGGWKALAPVSSGRIDAIRNGSKTIIGYQVSLFRARLVAIGMSCLSVVPWMLTGRFDIFLFFLVGSLAVGWGWVYGMNVAITSGRVKSIFRNALKELPPAPPEPPNPYCGELE